MYAVSEILERAEPEPDRIFNVMIYRLIGREETHAAIGFQNLNSFNSTLVEAPLRRLRADGRPPFTGAYMVSSYRSMGSGDKAVNVARVFAKLCKEFDSLYVRLRTAKCAEDAYEGIRSAYGYGPFLSFQVLVDLLYPLKAHGNKPVLPFTPDDWALAGPGARRGISVLLGGRHASRPLELEIMTWLRNNQRAEFARLGLGFPFLEAAGGQVEISLTNIENCLCEYYKYAKIKAGTGRGRRKFAPPAALPRPEGGLRNP